MRAPTRYRRCSTRLAAVLLATAGFLPIAASPGTAAAPEAPAGADEPRKPAADEPGRKADSLQIDPEAVFPPAPAAGIEAVALPVRLTEPPATYRGEARISPRQAGRWYATELPTIAGHKRRGHGHRAEFLPLPGAGTTVRSPGARGAGATPASSAPSPAAGPAAPVLSSSFDSTTSDTNVINTGGFLFSPADPMGAAGPDHLVNVVNVTIRFHQKDGTVDLNDDLAAFFSVLSPLSFTFDPKVVYDQHAGRFVVVTLEQTDTGGGDPADTSRILLAVSDDSDPAGIWFMTSIDAKTLIDGNEHWADYPGLAVDEEAIYVTANLFEFHPTFDFGGSRLWVIEKGEGDGGLYDGGTVDVHLYDPYAAVGIPTTTQPAHVFGVAPGGLGTFLTAFSGISDGTNEAVQVVRVDFPFSATFTHSFVEVGDIDGLTAQLPDAPQDKPAADPAHDVETNDRRALSAVWFDDSLWLTSTIDPKTGDPDAGEATAHWWEIDTSDLDTLTLADQGSILGEDLAADTFTFFPAVAINGAGQVAFGFSGSSATTQVGAHYTTHLPSTAPGDNTGSGTLRSGVAYYRRTFSCGTVSRWGDYSGMAVDPVDGCFWAYNKYAISRGTATSDCSSPPDGTPDEDGRWGTAFGKFCPAGACPPDLRIEGGTYTTTATESAGGQVITSGVVTVDSGADVTFQAGQRIALADGFNVQSGASFTATISPCSP